ncbi:MAG: MFS transporter [Gammaproteobacteria bacterium]|nr:MFS transporter [Gammaproteobacteria bacterium]
MLFLGFSAGLPILLIFSSLSVWLREASVDRSIVTYFSWAALGYSFKFVWAPLVDTLRIPFFTDTFGRRRSWLLLSQASILLAIFLMSQIDPAHDQGSLTFLALSAVLLGFSSATQDIVIDAYRIESASTKLQAMMSSAYIGGYRVGMLVAGAGALLLASYFGSNAESYQYSAWRNAYLVMSAFMLVGVITTLLIPEPIRQQESNAGLEETSRMRILALFVCCVCGFVLAYIAFGQTIEEQIKSNVLNLFKNKALVGLLVELLKLFCGLIVVWLIARALVRVRLVEKSVVDVLYLEPVREFFHRHGMKAALLMLLFVGLYRISDIVLGVISNVFYYDLGFSKTEIATVVKSFGLIMTLVGGAFGGVLCMRFGVFRVLLLGAVLSALTNLLFVLLAAKGNQMWLLYFVISADNLSAGLATAAFIAFLSALTNIRFTAMQYAIFSSLMTLLPKTIGGYSGSMVDAMGYGTFFTLTAIMGIPVIALILYIGEKSEIKTVGPLEKS